MLTVGKLLVRNGAKLEVENEEGETPLHLASREGHKSTSKYLIDKGNSYNQRLSINDVTQFWTIFDSPPPSSRLLIPRP